MPDIDIQDSGIVAPGDQLLSNGRTVREMRRMIREGLYDRMQVSREMIDRLIMDLQQPQERVAGVRLVD